MTKATYIACSGGQAVRRARRPPRRGNLCRAVYGAHAPDGEHRDQPAARVGWHAAGGGYTTRRRASTVAAEAAGYARTIAAIVARPTGTIVRGIQTDPLSAAS
jgi:hypothetical protein